MEIEPYDVKSSYIKRYPFALTITFTGGNEYIINETSEFIMSEPSGKDETKLSKRDIFTSLSFLAEVEFSPEFHLKKEDKKIQTFTKYSFATHKLFTLCTQYTKNLFDQRHIIHVTDKITNATQLIENKTTFYTKLVIDRNFYISWSLYFLLSEGSLPWLFDHPMETIYLEEIHSNVQKIYISHGNKNVSINLINAETEPIVWFGGPSSEIFIANIANFCDRLGLEAQASSILHMLSA